MRIVRLDLLAFGPFTDLSLELGEGDFGLQMVCGPNEAGKSSALRALRQFLYGIEPRSRDNFVHGYPSMRIGALLAGNDGEQFHLIRRKGNKDTLRSSDDNTPADSAILKRLLAGVDQNEFSQRFGIDHQELVEGSQDILRGGGQLGSLLFATGAGLADLNTIQSHLEEEADELFRPRGSNPKINACLKRLQEASKRRKEAQLRPTEWSAHMQSLRTAEAEKSKVDALLAEKRAEVGRLERLQQAIPLIARRQHSLTEREAVGDTPLLPDGFTDQRLDTVANLKSVKSKLADARDAVGQLDGDIAGLEVSDALLQNATLIESLQQKLGAIRKASQDRPTLVAQRDQHERAARQTLRELGRDISLTDADQLTLSRTQRARIRELVTQREVLTAKLETATRQIAELKQQVEEQSREQLPYEAVPDTAALHRAVRRVQRRGDVSERLAKEKSEFARLQHKADLELGKLGLWSGSLSDLESLPVPSRETVERYQTDFADLDGELADLGRRRTVLQEKQGELDAQLERHRLRQDALTEDDLHKARQRRDEGWKLVQATWQGESVEPSRVRDFIAEYDPANDLAQAFQFSVERADRVADRLRRESEQVAEKASLVTERRRAEKSLAALNDELAEKERLREDAERQWQELWSPLGITPLSPREMIAWSSRQVDLVQIAEKIREREAEADKLAKEVADCADQLSRELSELDESVVEPRDGFAIVDLLDCCEQVARQLDDRSAKRRELELQLEQLRKHLSAARQLSAVAEEELATWRDDWAQTMATLDLPSDATPAQADEVTSSIDDLLDELGKGRDLTDRISGIDSEVEQFTAFVARCAADLAPDLADFPPDQAASTLLDRLKTSQKAQAKLEQLQQQRQRQEDRKQLANSEMGQLAARLETLCSEAGCQSPDELADIEEKSRQRRECDTRLREVEDQLAPLAPGGSLPDLLDEAAKVDLDQLPTAIESLKEELGSQWERRTELSDVIAGEKLELRQMDGSGRAAEADEEAQGLLAQLRMDVEQFTRLRLASVILKQSIERYREKNQGPVLQRASRLFSALTLGSFAGLRDDYNEKGEPVLVGLRGDGRTVVGVSGMSDGTHDQLYLSLRLASLEYYLDQNEPIPFIVDDILVQFDDDRAAAALRILADLSDRTQVIFFTHHEHLAQVARKHVDAGKLFVHRLAAGQTARG